MLQTLKQKLLIKPCQMKNQKIGGIRRFLPIFLICLLVISQSCCKQPSIQTVTEYKLIKPPSSLLTPCPHLEFDMKTNGDMVMALIEYNTQYYLCSMKVQSIIEYYNTNSFVSE